MSKLVDHLFSKILAVIIIVLFVFAFRENILTNSEASTAFGALMGTLPFAKVITDMVCKILGFQYSLPIISTASVMTDLIRLAFMACLQPIIIGLLTAIFLPVPAKLDYAGQEEYMKSFSYKGKELLLTIISAPLLAIAAASLSATAFRFFVDQFGTIASIILGILTVAGLTAVSLVPLLVTGTTVATAIAWRLLVTLGAKMVTTFVTNAFCLGVYVALLGGIDGQIATSIISLIVWLIIMDFGVKCLQRSVVRSAKK